MFDLIANWLYGMFEEDQLLPTTVVTNKVRCLDFNIDTVSLRTTKQSQHIKLSVIIPERIIEELV